MKNRQCALCSNDCRKRDIVCAKCWNGLGQARRAAISRAPYSREEKNRKFLLDLLTCDIKTVNSIVADHKVAPSKAEEEVDAIYTEINAGK